LQGFDGPVTRSHHLRSYMFTGIYMVNSFQFTREVRLNLTHQKTQNAR
jgi:hypothetical protein